jgi:uncharacterized protein (DUF58 family)
MNKDRIDRNRLEQFGSLDFMARQVVEGFITGLHKSPYHGFSVEFAEHRIYNPGESTRHIDWKLFAKTDKMFVKRYEEETNLRCQLVIDQSSSMYFPVKTDISIDNPDKLTFSVYAAAAIMQLMKKQRDAVGLSLFGESVDIHTPAKTSPTHHELLYAHLEKLMSEESTRKGRSTFTIECLHEIAENIHKRSLVILFSDMFASNSNTEELFSALQHLKHNKHEVILFHVVDQQHEMDFEYSDRPYRFVDLESNEELRLRPHEVKERFTKASNAFKQELILKCGQYKIDIIEADINKGFEQVLLPYLIKRSKLY